MLGEVINALRSDLDPRIMQAMLLAIRNAALTRDPDVTIGGMRDPYLLRWWLIPRRKYDFNLYLHQFLRSDDDRALHDHPSNNVSILIEGEYLEHTPTGVFHRRAGEIIRREATYAHRVELIDGKPVWTLFLTGPKIRDWGFHCPKGWMPWQQFTGQSDDNGPVTDARVLGSGCGED